MLSDQNSAMLWSDAMLQTYDFLTWYLVLNGATAYTIFEALWYIIEAMKRVVNWYANCQEKRSLQHQVITQKWAMYSMNNNCAWNEFLCKGKWYMGVLAQPYCHLLIAITYHFLQWTRMIITSFLSIIEKSWLHTLIGKWIIILKYSGIH